MKPVVNLVGQVFGRLKVIALDRRDWWTCVCSCPSGKVRILRTYILRDGHTRSCGCLQREAMQSKRIDLKGRRVGRWTVVEYSHKKKTGANYWNCKCDCGNTRAIASTSLHAKTSKSCGCLHREVAAERTRKQFTGKFFCRRDWTGHRLGLLTMIKRSHRVGRIWMWECSCACRPSVKRYIASSNIRKTHSCGCLRDTASKRRWLNLDFRQRVIGAIQRSAFLRECRSP